MARLERLPFECYVLRGALDARARARATESIARYASRAAWARAAANDHPTIVASHARGQRERAMAMRARVRAEAVHRRVRRATSAR